MMNAPRSEIVQRTYREYLELAKSLLVLCETCSIKEWPDRKNELSNVFRLQTLYNEREGLRFDYWLRNNRQEVVSCSSLSKIHERLLKYWTVAEEANLQEGDSAYREVLREIQKLGDKTGSSKLDEPFQALTRNALYQEAREAFAKRIKKLDEQLTQHP